MHTLKILKTNYLTHDVKRFVLEKPKGFTYKTGQAADISINQPEWKDKLRPFTFTSLNDWPELEFIIKIYNDHDGVTKQMASLETGDELLMHEVFDTFTYKGPGIFLAGGNGITPFIAIFRALHASGNLKNVALLYSNKTKEDIVLGKELHDMLGAAYKNVLTREGVIGFRERHIDRDFLLQNIGKFDVQFYVCGPQSFTKNVSKALVDLGADHESISV